MLVIDIKRCISRSLFAAELIIFIWVYLFGVSGFRHLTQMRAECERAKQELERKQYEIDQKKEQIISWNVHSFHKERMAREQLQMARKGETIYYIS